MHHLDEITVSARRRFCAILYGGALSILFATAMLFFIGVSTPMAAKTSAPATPQASHGYFRNGQWRADALTLIAAARWCFEPTIPGNANNANLPPTLVTNTPAVTRT